MALWEEGARYSIVELPEFLEVAVAFAGSPEAWDTIKESIDLTLARRPESGERVLDTDVWAINVNDWPPYTIYYTIDHATRTVTLLALRMFDRH